MPHATTPSPRPRAPYAVYRGDQFLCLATTLAQLHAFLRDIEAARAIEQQEAQARRDFACNRGAAWYEIQPAPSITVIDSRGTPRPDLDSSWSVRYNCSPGGFRTLGCDPKRLVDPTWDGDIRPRGTPIPGTGVRVRYGRKYYRYPRTQRDRRLGYPVIDEGEPCLRGPRRPHIISNAWDDLPRRGHEDRSWKRFRGKQWVER